ncbi:hypothetical protein RQP46_001756 [Phenoliferia psychrophenolica]
MGFVPPRRSFERSSNSNSSGDEEGDELDTLINSRASLDSTGSNGLPTHHRRGSSGEQSSRRLKRVKVPSRYFGLCRNTATLLLLLYSLLCAFALFWVAKFLVLRHTAYSHSVFAAPMIPTPRDVEGGVSPVRHLAPNNSTLAALQHELDARLASIGLPPSTLPCTPWSAADERNYASLRTGGPTLLALNLWNNEVVLPTLARTLLTLADFLGRENVAISIFENGSTDNTTVAMAHLAAVLTAGGVEHSLVSDPRHTDWKRVDRIAQLSVYRNIALAPLNTTSRATPFENVVFVNDVFACPRDPLELLFQKRHQQADAACAMDWRATHSWLGFLGFRSVGRTITGDMFRSRFDIIAETRDGIVELFDQAGSEYSRDRWLAALPVPVYSCWNGMVAMSAAPFRGDDGPAISFRSALASENECSASECKTVARDFWVQGLRRWLVVPSVHVTYAEEVYSHPSLVAHHPALIPTTPTTPSELIEWDTIEPPENVVCYEWVRGFHLDLPYRRTREKPFRR